MKKKNKQTPQPASEAEMHPPQEDDFSLEEILQEFGHPHQEVSPDPQASALLDPALQLSLIHI